jgi:chromosome segregation ATPase
MNREINELKMQIDNIKEEVTHDMENLRKKNKTEIQNTMEGHSRRLEQVEDKMDIKGKTEELLVKQLKMFERNIQELTNSIKRPNLRIKALKKEKRCKQKELVIYSTK